MRSFRGMGRLRVLVLLWGWGLWGATLAQADLYQWTDGAGVVHVTDETGAVPTSEGRPVKVYRAEPASPPGERAAGSPSLRTGAQGLGAFATKLAVDLGLIKQGGEDALGALSRAEIMPVGGWIISAPLTPEVFYEVLAAARRAANAGHLALSADGAEAVVRAAVVPFLPAPGEASVAPPPFVEPESGAAGTGEEPAVLYEPAPPLVEDWLPGALYGPVVVIVRRPGVPHFLRGQRCPPACHPGGWPRSVSPFTFAARGRQAFPWQGRSPAVRGVLPGRRLFHPPASRLAVGTGPRRLSLGYARGGFLRR